MHGGAVCGRYATQLKTSHDVFAVDCLRCMSNSDFKQKLDASIKMRNAVRDELQEAGFDPDKPISEMSREEVIAYSEWLDQNS